MKNNNIELGIPAYTNDGIYCGRSFTFSTPDIFERACEENNMNRIILTSCKNIEELKIVESALFALEFKEEPDITPFYITVNGEPYYYDVVPAFGKYYITSQK